MIIHSSVNTLVQLFSFSSNEPSASGETDAAADDDSPLAADSSSNSATTTRTGRFADIAETTTGKKNRKNEIDRVFRAPGDDDGQKKKNRRANRKQNRARVKTDRV